LHQHEGPIVCRAPIQPTLYSRGSSAPFRAVFYPRRFPVAAYQQRVFNPLLQNSQMMKTQLLQTSSRAPLDLPGAAGSTVQMVLPMGEKIAPPLRILDLFAGAGGLALGFERLALACGCPAYTLAAAVDNDPDACATLRANHPTPGSDDADSVVIEGNLTSDKTHASILEKLGDAGVDVVIGGPPCQSYSQIGTRTGKWVDDERFRNDRRDLLFQEYVSLVTELLPKYIVLENVDGIRSKKDENGRPYLSLIIELLEKKGYTFRIAGSRRDKFLKLNAASYGVPQIRSRIFLIGNRLGLPFQPPPPTHHNPSLPPDRRPPGAKWPWVTLREAIGDLPSVLAHYTDTRLTPEEWAVRKEENLQRCHGADEQPYHQTRFDEHYRGTTEAGRHYLDFIKPPEGTPLRYHRARDQQASDIELFGLMPEGTTSRDIYLENSPLRDLARLIRYDMNSFKDKYRKQAWDQPCTTVFAHLDRDGNRFIHPDSAQARTFTVREASRVQSFPDDYRLAGGLKSRFRQIGNAVPPLLSVAIARAIYESLLQAGLIEHLCFSTVSVRGGG
jgi:DNA (cytosine-5)-methyltransferase 1